MMETGSEVIRKAITEQIENEKSKAAECEKKLQEIEQVKTQLSIHTNEVNRLEAALRALDGAPPPSPAPKAKKEPSRLPTLGAEWFLGLMSPGEKVNGPTMVERAVQKINLPNITSEEKKSISSRTYNTLVSLGEAGKVIVESTDNGKMYTKKNGWTGALQTNAE